MRAQRAIAEMSDSASSNLRKQVCIGQWLKTTTAGLWFEFEAIDPGVCFWPIPVQRPWMRQLAQKFNTNNLALSSAVFKGCSFKSVIWICGVSTDSDQASF